MLLYHKTTSLMNARWPTAEVVDELLLKESHYLNEVSHDFRVRIKKMMELKEKVCL